MRLVSENLLDGVNRPLRADLLRSRGREKNEHERTRIHWSRSFRGFVWSHSFRRAGAHFRVAERTVSSASRRLEGIELSTLRGSCKSDLLCDGRRWLLRRDDSRTRTRGVQSRSAAWCENSRSWDRPTRHVRWPRSPPAVRDASRKTSSK